MNILSIGNSFSEDAVRYLHKIARANGENVTVVNLYIGGCPLSAHYRNMMSGRGAYTLQYNGESTGFFTSLEEALLNRDWDYITFQQVSNLARNYDTYQPYLSELSDYVSACCPKAKQIIHQTWAYEEGSDRLTKELGYASSEDMFRDVKKAYEQAAEEINAEFIIPSGQLMLDMAKAGIKVHRDTFHADLGIGRYAIALLWYTMFTGKDPDCTEYSDFDVPTDAEQIKTVKEIIKKIIR